MSAPVGDDGEISATAEAMKRRRRPARTGAVVGFVITVVLTIVLLSFQGDEGDISSAPVWWTFIGLTGAALLVTGLVLITVPASRRFGEGFVAGALVALPVEAVILVALFVLTYSAE